MNKIVLAGLYSICLFLQRIQLVLPLAAAPTDKKMLPFSSTNTTFPKFNGSNATLGIGGSGGDQYIHGGTGVTHYAQGPSDATSSVAYITSDYNTGWMNGDIKLATLSDTDATNVTGSELVTNGTFSSDVSGWTGVGGSSVTHQSGQAKVTASSTNIMLTQQLSGLVVGQRYTVSATITPFIGVSGLYWGFYLSSSFSGNIKNFNANDQVATEISATFTATATNNSISLGGSSGAISSGEYLLVDNFSVRLAEEDRSVNGNGLQVFGTITKTAVATGAELVGYNTAPANTRLMLPDASDLAFGTGDFTIMMWVKEGTFNTNHYVMDKVKTDNSATGRLYVIINPSGKHLFGIPGRSGITSTGAAVATGVWQLVSFIRRSGILYCGINGDIIFSTSAPEDTENGTTGHKAYIGDFNGGQANYGFDSMALFRASKTGVSDDQLRKIYNDEKHLFQENAKATLYGSSDAVTALAYDDDTELLHVGTSAGRSVFQGLNRVDNTTDAVGAAISASNGFIVEE